MIKKKQVSEEILEGEKAVEEKTEYEKMEEMYFTTKLNLAKQYDKREKINQQIEALEMAVVMFEEKLAEGNE